MNEELLESNGTAWTDPIIGDIAVLVAESAGFTLKGKKAFRIERGVKERMNHLAHRTPAEYLLYLRGPMGRQELAVLTQTLTVNETHFFRHPEQFGLLRSWLEKRSAPSEMNPLRALCAGCSTGEEVYTAAMVLSDAFPWVHPGSLQVVGADIDSGALETARNGLYQAWSVARSVLPAGVMGRHLVEEAVSDPLSAAPLRSAPGTASGTAMEISAVSGKGRWRVAEPIRKVCRFERKNLMADDLGGPFDLVFCRNVLIYFEDPHKQSVLDNLVRSMKIGAVLFCGYAESLVHQSHYLDLREQNGVVYYVRWTPDRRASQADVSLDDTRRLLIEEGGIPLVFMSSRPAGGGEPPSASLVLAGVLSSNTSPENLSQRMMEKRERWLKALPPANGADVRGRLLLDLDGLRYAEEPYLKVLVDFARDVAKQGVGVTTRPPSNPRIREWIGRSPQREVFRCTWSSDTERERTAMGGSDGGPRSVVAEGDAPPPLRSRDDDWNRYGVPASTERVPPRGGPPSTGHRAGVALAALEEFMKSRIQRAVDQPSPPPSPRRVESSTFQGEGVPSPRRGEGKGEEFQKGGERYPSFSGAFPDLDLLTADLPPKAAAALEFRDAESPPRIVVAGRWPDDMDQVRRTEIEGKLARIAMLGPRSRGRWEPTDQLVLDLSTLDYAERWLADTLRRFRDSVRPVRLTVVGSMGTFRWLARMGAGDLA